MPVTHGVTGSSPVRTAKALPQLIRVAGELLFLGGGVERTIRIFSGEL